VKCDTASYTRVGFQSQSANGTLMAPY